MSLYLVKILSVGSSLFILFSLCNANVSLSKTFSNHLVLQRNMEVPIWGKASGGESVSVTLREQTKSTQASSNGDWKILLDPMEAAGPLTITVKGNNTVNITDVYIGEVWQVAGQSNMDTRLSFYPNLSDSIRNADLPLMRYYTLRQPGQNSAGSNSWEVVSPTTASELSACGYFFGKEILKKTGVAVGLVVTAVGGTRVSAWMDPQTLSDNRQITDSDRGQMWNTWVAPVVGYGIKGTVWIQGENNANSNDSPTYGDYFKLMIKGWRSAWGQGDFPFYYGQLSSRAGAPGPNDNSNIAVIREGQRMALVLPNTAMSVNFDIGIGDWHYPNKPEAGRRLSLPARKFLYGDTDLVYSGPLYTHNVVEENEIKLLFTHVGSGLVAKNENLTGFAIAGQGGNYVWGNARISGDTVIVSHSSISQPARVRYGWSDVPEASLFNEEGLPASPFTTESPELPVAMKYQINAKHFSSGYFQRGNTDILGRELPDRVNTRYIFFQKNRGLKNAN